MIEYKIKLSEARADKINRLSQELGYNNPSILLQRLICGLVDDDRVMKAAGEWLKNG